jgi:hypothetical protein
MYIPVNEQSSLKEFLRSFEKLNVPDREFILKVFHMEINLKKSKYGIINS